MVPVLLAPPPWANALEPNDSATNKARRPVVQRLMLSSFKWGQSDPQRNINVARRNRLNTRKMSREVTRQDTGRKGRIARNGVEQPFRRDGSGTSAGTVSPGPRVQRRGPPRLRGGPNTPQDSSRR